MISIKYGRSDWEHILSSFTKRVFYVHMPEQRLD